MKARWTISITVVAIGVGFAFLQVGLTSPAVAGDAIAAATAVLTTPAVGEYEYVGSSKCKKCHIKQHKSWKDTKMAKAFEVLKPGNSSEAKQKFDLDPAKDYSTDEKCLSCHTTGFGHAGGYAVPAPDDKKAVKTAQKLEGVGCESCHGPGSGYMEVFEEIQKSKRKYNVDELYAVGLTKMDAAACTSCHNDQSPTHDPAKAFDFEKDKDTDAHEHIPLEQRE